MTAWPNWTQLGLPKHNARLLVGFISALHISPSGTQTKETDNIGHGFMANGNSETGNRNS